MRSTTKYPQTRIKPKTKARFNAYGKTRRLNMVDTLDVASVALEALTPEQEESIIRTGKLPSNNVKPSRSDE